MTTFDFVIIALATFRVSLLLAKEDGPASCIKQCRAILPTWLPRDCIWCWSISVGVLMAALYFMAGEAYLLFTLPLSLSGAAIILNQQWTKD